MAAILAAVIEPSPDASDCPSLPMPHQRRPLLLTFALLALAAPAARGGSPTHCSFLGRRPPELASEQKHWLGCSQRLTLGDLRGQVVWLQFNF